MNTPPNTFADANRASEVIGKIGRGSLDADFARAMHDAIDRAQQTHKKCRVVTVIEIEPDEERGCLLIRGDVIAKLAKLPPPASQMHIGSDGGLLTQQEWLMGGGQDESARKPLPIEFADKEQTGTPSGRFKVVQPPAPAPVAAAPAPQPVKKD